MGVQDQTMSEPGVGPTGPEERWVCVLIGFEGGVSENAGVEREGNVGVVGGERRDEGVEEEGCGVGDLVEEGEGVG